MNSLLRITPKIWKFITKLYLFNYLINKKNQIEYHKNTLKFVFPKNIQHMFQTQFVPNQKVQKNETP